MHNCKRYLLRYSYGVISASDSNNVRRIIDKIKKNTCTVERISKFFQIYMESWTLTSYATHSAHKSSKFFLDFQRYYDSEYALKYKT